MARGVTGGRGDNKETCDKTAELPFVGVDAAYVVPAIEFDTTMGCGVSRVSGATGSVEPNTVTETLREIVFGVETFERAIVGFKVWKRELEDDDDEGG